MSRFRNSDTALKNKKRSYSSSSDSDSGDSDDSSRSRRRRREMVVELDNQQFFFLMQYEACPNDKNSIYNSITNRMNLVKRNAWRMENGYIIGKLMTNLRKKIIQVPGREDFPILDPVLGKLIDKNNKQQI